MKKLLLCWLCVSFRSPSLQRNTIPAQSDHYLDSLMICRAQAAQNEAQLYITTCARRKALAWIFMEVRGHPTQGAPRKRAGSGADSQLCFGERASLAFVITKGTVEGGNISQSSASFLEYMYRNI